MGRFQCLAALPILLLAAAAVLAADEPKSGSGCTADLRIEETERQHRDDGTEIQFSVEIETAAACAEVQYDVVVEQREPSEQVHRVRVPMTARVRDGELTQVVKHLVPTGYEMLDYEVQFIGCGLCEEQPEP